jgi:hypothetical protein
VNTNSIAKLSKGGKNLSKENLDLTIGHLFAFFDRIAFKFSKTINQKK